MMNKESRIRESKKRRIIFSWLFLNSYFVIPRSSKQGFTLLFSVLIGALFFTLGMSIANIGLKEIILSSASRESERAFFSADAGIECALYWDIQRGVFPASDVDVDPTGVVCGGNSINIPSSGIQKDRQGAITKFSLVVAPFCADVSIEKTKVPAGTVIESRGRNDCGTNDNPSRVERALRVTY